MLISVRPLVGRSVCHDFLKGREVTHFHAPTGALVNLTQILLTFRLLMQMFVPVPREELWHLETNL